MKPKVLVVDDHAMLREGVKGLLERNGFDVVGEAGDGQEALEAVHEYSPDLVIMDITMPNVDGIEATRNILGSSPRTRVIALSIHGGKRFVENMLQAGVTGYVLKDSVPEQLVEAVRAVLKGDIYLSPSITGLMVGQYVDLLASVQAGGGPEPLTENEQQYVQLLGAGCNPEEIAELLATDHAGVKALEQAVLENLQLSRTEELVEFAGARKWFIGQESIDTAIHQAMTSRHEPARNRTGKELIETLTNREFEVLELLAERLHDKEIAVRLCITVATVKTHISHILQKLDVRNRRAAAIKARQLGLIK
jgi:LuxR family maltose regulon positive regulatory protein